VPGEADGFAFPAGFDRWPREIREQWMSEVRALYFPKLRWWQKPETEDEDSGPRPKQLPPDHPRHGDPDLHGYRCGCVHKIPWCRECPPCKGNPGYSVWLMCTSRGTGKTKAGANWTLEMALSMPGIHVGVCAPKYDDVRGVCFEGESGVLAEARRSGIEITEGKDYNKNRLEISLPNGSQIRGFSAERPDSIRGQNLSYCWFDELAMIRYVQFFHEGLMPALRKGKHPRLLITTTPKRVRLIRKLIDDARYEFAAADGGPGTGVHLTEAIAAENIHFSRVQRERLEREYAGNPVMLAQELRGELLGEVDGALFPADQFNESRVFPDKDKLPAWRRVVVAIDPATTSNNASDETGIVVMAEGADGDFYCLEDCSGKFSPDQQMNVAAEAFYRHEADCVVGEVNMTGDYMRALLNTVDPNIPLRTVRGMRGKAARAQGASSLFMQGRIHMVGDSFTRLEEQLSAMAEGDDRSRMKDDRADAFVWAMIHLAGGSQGDWGMVYGFDDCTACGARVSYEKDAACRNCGARVVKPAPKHAGGAPRREPWSAAYLKTCLNEKCGKTYPPHERACPHCSPSPEAYMRKLAAFTGGRPGRVSYTGRNWLAGRKL
jgi:phage terminase large subunit-like protein